jgi:hypothetical protein
MKKKVSLVAIIMFVFLINISAQIIQKWDYTVYVESSEYPSSALFTAVLNTYGEKGWELVSVNINKSGQWIFFFKRIAIE